LAFFISEIPPASVGTQPILRAPRHSSAARNPPYFRRRSIPFCSLFSKNTGELHLFGTRRTRIGSASYTNARKGISTGDLVQQNGENALRRRIDYAPISTNVGRGSSGVFIILFPHSAAVALTQLIECLELTAVL
jgi:hypothetical protein